MAEGVCLQPCSVPTTTLSHSMLRATYSNVTTSKMIGFRHMPDVQLGGGCAWLQTREVTTWLLLLIGAARGKPLAISRIRQRNPYNTITMIGDGITDLEAVQVGGRHAARMVHPTDCWRPAPSYLKLLTCRPNMCMCVLLHAVGDGGRRPVHWVRWRGGAPGCDDGCRLVCVRLHGPHTLTAALHGKGAGCIR
jgi:hypothetical protein